MDAEARLIRWGGYAALGGVVVFVLWVGTMGATGGFPDFTDTPALLAFFADNATLGAAANWLFVAFLALLILAVLGFHAALRATKLPLVFGTALFVTGIALSFVLTAQLMAILSLASDYVEAGEASRLAIVAAADALLAQLNFLDVSADILTAVGIAILALASLDTRMVARWLGWAAVAGAVVWGVGSPLRDIPGLLMVSWTMQGVGLLAGMPWFAGMGIKMVRGSVSAAAGAGGRA